MQHHERLLFIVCTRGTRVPHPAYSLGSLVSALPHGALVFFRVRRGGRHEDEVFPLAAWGEGEARAWFYQGDGVHCGADEADEERLAEGVGWVLAGEGVFEGPEGEAEEGEEEGGEEEEGFEGGGEGGHGGCVWISLKWCVRLRKKAKYRDSNREGGLSLKLSNPPSHGYAFFFIHT